jgi:hypothetical protein
LKGYNDGRVVDLSFFNASQNLSNPDPDRPSKVIFDKNDTTGSLLPLLFPQGRGQMVSFLRDGVYYNGISHPTFSTASHESGVMERVNSNTYHVCVQKPNTTVVQELNSRGITLFSGNLPLRSVEHTISLTGNRFNTIEYVYIYANRRDATGVFNPSDPNILPSS